jgi:acyl carrier protein phosphodiesterase
MNWLAHLYLSEPEPEFRLGNLLADHARGADRARMSPAFLRGVTCHQAIDVFAERHPVVLRSRQRISTSHRRFSGILVDIFYDHCLARDWARYAPIPLAQFTQTAYTEFTPLLPQLPAEARITLERIIAHDWLTSYAKPAGIEDILTRLSLRLSERFQREVTLHTAMADLLQHDTSFTADFHEFFPALRQQIKTDWSLSP